MALDIYEMAIRILVASAAGALIGYERYVQEFRIASPETERTDMRAVDNAIEWPVSAGLLYGRCWAGLRPSGPAVATSSARLHLSLLRDLQRVVDLDPEVSDGALKFAMAEEKLDGPEIPGPPVDQRRFGAPH